MVIKSGAREAMFKKIERWQQSGLTQKAWCEENKVRYHIFHYWYKHYRDAGNEAAKPAVSFIPLQVQQTDSQPLMELVIGSDKRVLFYQPVSSDFLRSLIS